MTQFIVISPTYQMGEFLCRSILGINPKEHVIPLRSILEGHLHGLYEPVVFLYPNNSCLWDDIRLGDLETELKICKATIVYMPEVQRVNR